MDQSLSPEELQWLRRNLVILGEAAHNAGKAQIVKLAVFYWERVNDQLEATRLPWRMAA